MAKYEESRIKRLCKATMSQPTICTERAKLITESYRQTEGEPAPIRRGKAFQYLMENMTVKIYPDEKIVGKQTSKIRGGSISPELQCDWILNELDLLSERDSDPFTPVPESDREILRDVVSYWKDKSLREQWHRLCPPDAKNYDDLIMGGGAYCGNNQFPGHSTPDYSQILQYGAEGLIDKVNARLKERCTPEEEAELKGMLYCLDGLITIGDRYAAEAYRMAYTEKDAERKAELMDISVICRKVPRKPAEDFREAVQSVWFTYMGVLLENYGTGNGFLRIDQYLYPYYLKSKENGMSDQEAFEYMAMILVNCNASCVVYSEQRCHGFAGNNSGASFTIGGLKRDGSSAVNELSYIILEAERAVNMVSDDIVVRVSENSPEDYLTLACEVARDGGGKLKFLGDKTTIANLLEEGMTQEQANDYALEGCTSPEVAGESYNMPGGIVSLPGILELALNNGVHRLTGLQLGEKVGDAREFTSYEEVMEAFKTQVRYVVPFLHQIKNADKEAFATYMPSPLQSVLMPCCVERATDVISGGTKPFYHFALSLAGAPNVGDSLAAIKKLVFEEQRVTMGELIEAINHNWEGYEQMQKLFLRAPKFGNDDPYVDSIVNEVLSFVSDEVCKYPGYNGARSQVAAAAVTANVGLGMVCGATPDGRCAGEPISEGGISPAQGRNISGATATMMSIAKLDHSKLHHGEVLNMRMNPDAVDTPEKLEKFKALIKSYVAAGGFLVQFNIVSTETLKDAQINPEKHRDLVVRVATYAAYFVELGKELQNDIIHRLEMQSC